MKQIRQRLTYANVMSSIAVFFVLGGATAFAADQLGKNSVGSKQIKKNAVTTAQNQERSGDRREGEEHGSLKASSFADVCRLARRRRKATPVRASVPSAMAAATNSRTSFRGMRVHRVGHPARRSGQVLRLAIRGMGQPT